MSQYRRSPFLVVGLEGRDIVLQNCDTMRRFKVDERTLQVLSRLDSWASATELTPAGISEADLAHLTRLGVVEERGAPDDDSATKHYWDPFDLAVQRRQNVERYRESELRARREPPPPATKPRAPGRVITLPGARDLPGSLQEALRRRRSVRTYAARPLELEELSSVLYHSSRPIAQWHDDLLGDHIFRPFASAGARSELEIYVIANDISGVPAGAHYYDYRIHELVHLRDQDEHQERLNKSMCAATGQAINRDPQAILLITAVFARVMWKYRGLGLGLLYKDTGCLLQTLYLVATAFDLAPCAIGAGEERDNARWLGLDPLLESQVGAFLLGTKAA
ncbi:MAG: SagB family peptide dehydrogenase [Actinomycetota bacterium]|nr:SagB family peptide dehydrogenase [Actinomycetota bacterium]